MSQNDKHICKRKFHLYNCNRKSYLHNWNRNCKTENATCKTSTESATYITHSLTHWWLILLLPLAVGQSPSVVSFLLDLLTSLHFDLSLSFLIWISFFPKLASTTSSCLNLGPIHGIGPSTLKFNIFFGQLESWLFQLIISSWVGCCWDNLKCHLCNRKYHLCNWNRKCHLYNWHRNCHL